MRPITLLLCVTALLTACAPSPPDGEADSARYTMQVLNQASVVRLDRITGELIILGWDGTVHASYPKSKNPGGDRDPRLPDGYSLADEEPDYDPFASGELVEEKAAESEPRP